MPLVAASIEQHFSFRSIVLSVVVFMVGDWRIRSFLGALLEQGEADGEAREEQREIFRIVAICFRCFLIEVLVLVLVEQDECKSLPFFLGE